MRNTEDRYMTSMAAERKEAYGNSIEQDAAKICDGHDEVYRGEKKQCLLILVIVSFLNKKERLNLQIVNRHFQKILKITGLVSIN